MSAHVTSILWALTASIVLAFQGVVISVFLKRIGILAVCIFTNAVNCVVLGLVGFWTYQDGEFDWIGLGWFSLLGITAYSYGRFVYYKALSTIGPPRLTTLMSTSPLLSLGLAVLFLSERPGLFVLTGTALVILGVALVSYEPDKNQWFHKGIIWGFASALSMGLSTFIRKKGLDAFPNTALTIAWGNLIGIPVLMSLRSFVHPSLFVWGGRYVVVVVLLMGVLNAANQVFMNLAVLHGEVSVVSPIITSSPIFSLLLTALFIRNVEKIKLTMIIGIFFTVFGMIAISLGRS